MRHHTRTIIHDFFCHKLFSTGLNPDNSDAKFEARESLVGGTDLVEAYVSGNTYSVVPFRCFGMVPARGGEGGTLHRVSYGIFLLEGGNFSGDSKLRHVK